MTIIQVALHAGTTTWTVPSNYVSLVSIGAIGAGQAGYDGTNGAAAPGAMGGAGGSYAGVSSASIAANDVLPVQIGTGGASNGANGGDTWIKTAGGSTIALAKGGGSASVDIGTVKYAGGLAQTRTFSGIYDIGKGGGGGGGAAGPDGAGGRGGDLNGYVEISGGGAWTIDNGTGGGGANGGQDGGGTWSVNTPQFHAALYVTDSGGNSKRTADTFLTPQVIPGDGGDAGPGMYTFLSPDTLGPNVGTGFCGLANIGVYGQGGRAGKAGFTASAYFTPDIGVAAFGFQSDNRRTIGAHLGGAFGGGAGRLLAWSVVAVGPGGGGGGTGYGVFGSGAAGGNYGGGGGGGANSASALSGGPGADGVLVIIYDTEGTGPPPVGGPIQTYDRVFGQ